MTLRRALENSKNLATAHLLQGGIAHSAPESLDKVCARRQGRRSSTRSASATIRSSWAPSRCGRSTWRCSTPRSSTRASARRRTSSNRSSATGETVYRAQPKLTALAGVDRPAAFQLRTILQGVLARGTARSIGHLSSFVGGKTGTSDDENDAWFVGFSNDVTIAVWVGYDNKRGKRTLGGGQTGGKVAVPIFAPIMEAVWQHHAPKTALRGPSPEAVAQPRRDADRRQQRRPHRLLLRRAALLQRRAHLHGRQRTASRSTGGFTEYLRTDSSGRMTDIATFDLARQLLFGERSTRGAIRRSAIRSGCSATTGHPTRSSCRRTRTAVPRLAAEQRAELGRSTRHASDRRSAALLRTTTATGSSTAFISSCRCATLRHSTGRDPWRG